MDTVKGYVCGDCLGPLVIMGIYETYFKCTNCGLKNCFVKVKETETDGQKFD